MCLIPCTDASLRLLVPLTAQLTIEYLLNVQDALYTHTDSLERRCSALEECVHGIARAPRRDGLTRLPFRGRERARLVGETASQREEMDRLRRLRKNKRESLTAYEFLLSQPRGALGAIASRPLPHASPPSQQPPWRAGKLYPCPECAKVFSTAEFLRGHQQRKHQAAAEAAAHEAKEEQERAQRAQEQLDQERVCAIPSAPSSSIPL